jgi:hypothetical protein
LAKLIKPFQRPHWTVVPEGAATNVRSVPKDAFNVWRSHGHQAVCRRCISAGEAKSSSCIQRRHSGPYWLQRIVVAHARPEQQWSLSKVWAQSRHRQWTKALWRSPWMLKRDGHHCQQETRMHSRPLFCTRKRLSCSRYLFHGSHHGLTITLHPDHSWARFMGG